MRQLKMMDSGFFNLAAILKKTYFRFRIRTLRLNEQEISLQMGNVRQIVRSTNNICIILMWNECQGVTRRT
jgi:hypothetical protein